MEIKEFFKLNKLKLTFFILLLLILIFLRLYPISVVSCSWKNVCDNGLTFNSLYGVVKNGFDWSPIIMDASIHYMANPLYLVLYVFYVFLIYKISSNLAFFCNTKFLATTKPKLIILILALLSFAPILTRLFGFNYTSFVYGVGEFISVVLLPFSFLNRFLFLIPKTLLKSLDFGSPSGLNVSLGLFLEFAMVILFWYLIACLFMFTYNKIKKKRKSQTFIPLNLKNT